MTPVRITVDRVVRPAAARPSTQPAVQPSTLPIRQPGARRTGRIALPAFLDVVELEAIDRDVFRGGGPATAGFGHHGGAAVRGGQIAVQAQLAAGGTVEGSHPIHSLHAQFPRPARGGSSIVYLVDRVRDGVASATRRVTGVQAGEVVCVMSLSYQRSWRGGHQLRAPRVPPPEALDHGRTDPREPADLIVDLRPVVDAAAGPGPGGAPPRRAGPVRPVAWVRLAEALPDGQRLHAGALTYIADHAAAAFADRLPPLSARESPPARESFAAREPLPEAPAATEALDHAAWFHRPFRADEWLLLVQDSPSSAGPRTLTRSIFFSRDGLLVASTAQELALGQARLPPPGP